MPGNHDQCPIRDAVHARMVRILKSDVLDQWTQTRLELTELETAVARLTMENERLTRELAIRYTGLKS